MIMNYLPRSFFARDTELVAQELLGKVIIRVLPLGIYQVRIVETECYTHNDPACHAFRGKTERNSSLFGPVGHAYVYLSYGIHYCLNFVAREPGVHAGGVLIRAVESLTGIPDLREQLPVANYRALTNGPGKLTKALKITKQHDSIDLCAQKELLVGDDGYQLTAPYQATTRIGISQGKDKLWRFYIPGNSFVSR